MFHLKLFKRVWAERKNSSRIVSASAALPGALNGSERVPRERRREREGKVAVVAVWHRNAKGRYEVTRSSISCFIGRNEHTAAGMRKRETRIRVQVAHYAARMQRTRLVATLAPPPVTPRNSYTRRTYVTSWHPREMYIYIPRLTKISAVQGVAWIYRFVR